MKKIMSAVLTICCLLFNLHGVSTAQAQTTFPPQQKTVKVGYLIYKGFQEGVGESPKSGYGYEYLQEIGYAANWKYEYVYGGFGELLQKLERGEIDIMGNVSYTPERAALINYPQREQGKEQYYLYVQEDRTDIKADDPSTLNGKRIGVNKGSFQETLFKDWMQKNNVHCELIGYTSGAKRHQDVLNGVLDATVSNLVMDKTQQSNHLRALFQTGSSAFYIAVNRNRPDLLADLNAAQAKILQYDWYYNERVFLKYYGDNSVTLANLSIEDKQWFKSKGNFTVGYLDNALPFSCWDEKKQQLVGILAVYKEHVHNRYNIDITAKHYASYEQLRAALTRGEIDAIYPFFSNYWTAEQNNLMTTTPLNTSFLVMLYKGDYKGEATASVIAVARNNSMQEFFVKTYYPHAQLFIVDDLNACIKAVLEGKATSTIISAEAYYANRNRLDNIDDCNIINTGFSVPLGFAVRKGNIAAFNFIKHSMTGLLPSDISKAMIEGGYGIPDPSIKQFLQRHMLLTIVLVIIITLCIFGFLSYYIFTKQRFISLNRHNFELNKKIYIDFTTGLPNKNKCEELLASSAPIKKPTACAMFDLNELKAVNDHLGHEKGDMMIYTFAQLLRQAVPAKYFVGRFGGDEFILIAENIVNKAELEKIIQNVSDTISTFNASSKDFQISYAYGCTFSKEYPGLTIAELLHEADEAMYKNKRALKTRHENNPKK